MSTAFGLWSMTCIGQQNMNGHEVHHVQPETLYACRVWFTLSCPSSGPSGDLVSFSSLCFFHPHTKRRRHKEQTWNHLHNLTHSHQKWPKGPCMRNRYCKLLRCKDYFLLALLQHIQMPWGKSTYSERMYWKSRCMNSETSSSISHPTPRPLAIRWISPRQKMKETVLHGGGKKKKTSLKGPHTVVMRKSTI